MEPTGLSAIGLDWKALLFQLLNFVILLWLLKRFAYRPVVNLLEARRQKIAESLANADEIARQQDLMERQRGQQLQAVAAEAAALLAESKREASQVLQVATEKAQQAATQVRQQTEAALAAERAQLRSALKNETLSLVKRLSEKVLAQKLDSSADEQFIKQALQDLSHS